MSFHFLASVSACASQDIHDLEAGAQLKAEERLTDLNLGHEQVLVKRIASRIVFHVAPIIMLAHSRTNLPAKTRVFLHTLGLLAPNRAALVELCQSIVSFHTDYGVEKGIARIADVPCDVILPYLHADQRGLDVSEQANVLDFDLFSDHMPLDDMELFSDETAQQPQQDTGGDGEGIVSFEGSLEGPDMMHIIHNATNNLGDVMSCYGPTLASLKSLCSLLSGRESKQQLIETCFNHGPAIACQDMISSFDIGVHEQRWNTIASAIEDVHALEAALRTHWNLSQFLGEAPGVCEDSVVPAERPAANDVEAFGVGLRTVDEAICSDKFWGAIKVLLPIAMVQREAVRWANGCACHNGLEKELRLIDHPPPEWKQLVEMCPLRGRRCSELAAGDFFQLLRKIFEESATRLEYQLPRGLSLEDVAGFIKDFHLARQHLLTTYVVKLSFWTEAPHVLAGLAHPDPTVRVQSVQKCLASGSKHPKIMELRRHVLAVQELMESGGLWGDSDVMLPLRLLATEFRLMFTSAWRVEGQHARTKKAAQHAPHHSAAYTSLTHRLPEIKECVQDDPEAVTILAKLMDQVSNGRSAARALGFSEDLLKHCGWISARTFEKKKVGFSVIYHDDPYCKYTLDLPSLEQRSMTRRALPAAPRDPAEAADLLLQEGSVLLRRALALLDVRRAMKRGMFFTTKMNMRSLHTLQSLLGPAKETKNASSHFPSVEGFLTWEAPSEALEDSCELPLLPDIDQTGLLPELAEKGFGFQTASADGDAYVVASILHEQPTRFHRTHVEEEASLAGVWLVQLHTVVKADPTENRMEVSLAATSLGSGQDLQSTPLTLNLNQLTLSELSRLKVWELEDRAMSHTFSRETLGDVSDSLFTVVPDVVQLLLKSPDGLAITARADHAVSEAVGMMADEGFVVGPPWKLTERAHELLIQCVPLQSGRPVLEYIEMPLAEMSTYQLILALDKKGWTHEVVSSDKHKHLKRTKFTHTDDGQRLWFSEQGRVSVSFFYLLALARLGDAADGVGTVAGSETALETKVVREVPYGAADVVYKKLLGLEPEGPVGGKRRYQRKIKFGHMADDVWPDDEEKQVKRKKAVTRTRTARSKKARTEEIQGGGEDEEGGACSNTDAENEGNSSSSASEAPDASAGTLATGAASPISAAQPDKGDAPVQDAGLSAAASPPQPGPSKRSSSPSSPSSSSDSGSGSRSSSSSTTSSTCSSSSDPAEQEPQPEPPLPPPDVPPRGGRRGNVRRDRGFVWGEHTITPVGPSDDDPAHYQITCAFSAHNTAGQKCTKKRSVKFGGKDTVLLCLKYWASLGSGCSNATEHWAMWDEVVIPAWKNNALPELKNLSSDSF